MKLRINYKLILFISLVFSYLAGSNFYGFGIDYYVAYSKPNLSWGNWYDTLGYRVSTLTIFDINFGVYLVSFLLSISWGILFKKFVKFKEIDSILFFIFIYVMTLHTWPIIMSTSNAMRQGIAMSLFFLSFSFLLEQKNFKSIFFAFLSIFLHKSGIILFIILINVYFVKFVSNSIKINKYIIIFYILYGIFFLFFIYYLLILNRHVDIAYSKIIERDYRYHFIFISFVYILLFSYNFSYLKTNTVALFLYLFTFGIFSVFLLGLNWEYERFMMMMILPYILIFCMLLNKNSSYLFLTFSITSLLLLTIYNGMYNALYKTPEIAEKAKLGILTDK